MIAYKLALILSLFLTTLSFAEPSPRDAAIGILNQVEEGTNAFDQAKVLSAVNESASMISKNGEVVLDKAGVDEYFTRMVKGKAVLKKLTSVGRFTHEPIISGPMLIWLGDSDDHYEFTSGLDLKIKTVFTSVMRKEADQWKIQHIHFGFDAWDYPILSAAKSALTYLPIIIFLLAGLVTYFVFWIRKKRMIGRLVTVTSLLLALIVPMLTSGDTTDLRWNEALSQFWKDPGGTPLHPLFTSITSRGQVTQGKSDFLSLKDRPETTTLGSVLKTQVFPDSAILIGTVNETFRESSEKTITFENNFSAVFLSVQGKWLLSAYQTSSNLFDNPLLKEARTQLLIRGVLAALAGILIAWTTFRRRALRSMH